MAVQADDVLKFWLDECAPSQWYVRDYALDMEITNRFGKAWQAAANGTCGLWLTYPSGALAYIILTDQFSRNMFRDDSRAFSLDKAALAAAKSAIDKGWDLRIDEPARQFFYMPLMHSENLCDQSRCVRLLCERMPKTGALHLLHAQAHRDVIRKFGRFPYRNAALGRKSSVAEGEYIEQGGYAHTLHQIQQQQAAA